MATTPNLELTELVAAQAQPHIPINTALRRIDSATQITVIAQEPNPPGAPVEGDRYIVSTGGAGDWLDHDGEVAFYAGTAWEFIIPKEGWIAYDQDQARYVRCFGGSPLSWGPAFDAEVPFFYPGVPTNSQVMFKRVAVRQMTFPANFAGSYGHIGTNPTAVTALDVKINGASVGTISISTGGVFTFTTSGGAEQIAAAGQRIEIVNQASADATAANIAATLLTSI